MGFSENRLPIKGKFIDFIEETYVTIDPQAEVLVDYSYIRTSKGIIFSNQTIIVLGT